MSKITKEILTALNNDGVQHFIEFDNEKNEYAKGALCGKRLKGFEVAGEDDLDKELPICEKCFELKKNYVENLLKRPQIKGLIIKEPWIDRILNGEKIWEIRGSGTSIRGTIALIKSGTGMIYGTVDLVDSIKLSEEEYLKSSDKHFIPLEGFISMPYDKTHAWVIENPVKFEKPIPYIHPQGAVIWVNLPCDILDTFAG